MKKFTCFTLLASSVVLISCQSDFPANVDDSVNKMEQEVVYLNWDLEPLSIDRLNPTARTQNDFSYLLKLHAAEYITAPGSSRIGKTVIFSDRGNKQLDYDFSPLASLDGSSDISYYVDLKRPPESLSTIETEAAIVRAANTWENIRCSEIGLHRVPDLPMKTGNVAASLGFLPSATGYIADVNHCGWMPGSFFDLLADGGSGFILGVTFTFLLVDENENLIDTNNDGKFDVGLREIYYNDAFNWNGENGIDAETIALHEMGHGLSQGHFGKAFVKKNGQVQFAPKAVMNAAYSGIQTKISGTDLGGHCSTWANWPDVK